MIERARTHATVFVQDKYLGSFLTGQGCSFKLANEKLQWPTWFPSYVPALYGMNLGDYEMAGGYAMSFTGHLTKFRSAFAESDNDDKLGFPLLDIPPDTYPFQSNSSGALFHINRDLLVLYPDVDNKCFSVLDPLETFTRKNMQQFLHGREWFAAFAGRGFQFLD